MSPAPELKVGQHLSGETLDLLLIGALSPFSTNAAKAHLDGCEPCRTRWRELNEDKRRFEEHVFARTLPKVEAEVARSGGYPKHRPRRRARRIVVGLGAALVLGLLVWQAPSRAGPSLEVHVERQGKRFMAPPQASIEPGDRLRLVVTARKASYVLVTARDKEGATRVYFPPGGRASARVTTTGPFELASGVELEGAPGPQLVVAVFSEELVSVDALEGSLAQPALGPGATVVTLPLAKAQ